MEKHYVFNQSDSKLVEKIIDDDAAMINHMILNKGDCLPEHKSNSNVYMIVVRGNLTLQLAENPEKHYSNGSVINIPYDIKMNVSNQHDEQVEFFVVKSPSPRIYSE
jgi:quercetin dioxygenase-like cupin family protein